MSTIKMKTHHRERKHPGYRMAKVGDYEFRRWELQLPLLPRAKGS